MEEELRDLLCKYFRGKHKLSVYYTGSAGNSLAAFGHQLGTKVPIQAYDYGVVLSEVWNMTMERIVQPEWSAGSTGRYVISGFKLTEYGATFLEGPPIDHPSQYIEHLRERVANIDDEVITYVRESLTAYNHGCYFASTVMLGIASERLFEILLDAYTDFIPTQNAQTQFKRKITGRGISTGL